MDAERKTLVSIRTTPEELRAIADRLDRGFDSTLLGNPLPVVRVEERNTVIEFTVDQEEVMRERGRKTLRERAERAERPVPRRRNS
jgi:hypothetical protein